MVSSLKASRVPQDRRNLFSSVFPPQLIHDSITTFFSARSYLHLCDSSSTSRVWLFCKQGQLGVEMCASSPAASGPSLVPGMWQDSWTTWTISIKCLTRTHQHLERYHLMALWALPAGCWTTFENFQSCSLNLKRKLSVQIPVHSCEDNVIICEKVCSVRFTLRECPPSAPESQDSLASPCLIRFFIF